MPKSITRRIMIDPDGEPRKRYVINGDDDKKPEIHANPTVLIEEAGANPRTLIQRADRVIAALIPVAHDRRQAITVFTDLLQRPEIPHEN